MRSTAILSILGAYASQNFEETFTRLNYGYYVSTILHIAGTIMIYIIALLEINASRNGYARKWLPPKEVGYSAFSILCASVIGLLAFAIGRVMKHDEVQKLLEHDKVVMKIGICDSLKERKDIFDKIGIPMNYKFSDRGSTIPIPFWCYLEGTVGLLGAVCGCFVMVASGFFEGLVVISMACFLIEHCSIWYYDIVDENTYNSFYHALQMYTLFSQLQCQGNNNLKILNRVSRKDFNRKEYDKEGKEKPYDFLDLCEYILIEGMLMPNEKKKLADKDSTVVKFEDQKQANSSAPPSRLPQPPRYGTDSFISIESAMAKNPASQVILISEPKKEGEIKPSSSQQLTILQTIPTDQPLSNKS